MFGFGWCSGMGVGGWVLMIAFWGGFVALVVWAIARLFPTGGERSRSDAVDRLVQRFAAGEIDAQAYRQARDDLMDPSRR